MPESQSPRIAEVVQSQQGDINYFDKSINSCRKLLLIPYTYTVHDSSPGACPSPQWVGSVSDHHANSVGEWKLVFDHHFRTPTPTGVNNTGEQEAQEERWREMGTRRQISGRGARKMKTHSECSKENGKNRTSRVKAGMEGWGQLLHPCIPKYRVC